MSQVVPETGGTAVAMTTGASSSSYSFSSSSSSSFSATSSKSTASSTKVMKQSTTSMKSSSSSSSSTTTSSSRSSSVNVRSSGMSYSDRIAGDLGIDVGKEMERLRLCMSKEMANIHSDMFQLKPGSPDAAPAAQPALDAAQFIVKLDDNAVRSCIDKAHDDRMKLNFDVQEFDSETIDIKTVGNKIEIHAMKKSKKGDEERSEEFSRVYELPTEKDVDPSKVTSSIYQDGVLTIELPVADALGQSAPAQ